ncbi:hypothetical protein IAD21_00514 [Abditibacteriota bacterium]|nr:hypothetical protein IAD21_00514 [Abditibacteriota bacterium]
MQPEPAVQDIFGEHPYSTLVAETRDFAIFLVDQGGRIVSWNEGARLLFGYENEEIVGQLAEVLFVPEDQQHGVPQREINTARAEDVRWHLKKDGGRFWANGVMTPFHNEEGKLCGFAKIARDDTARKQSEDAARANQERFDLVSRATRDAIWDCNVATGDVWWNNNVQVLFGYTTDGGNKTREWWMERIHPDDRTRVVASIIGVLRGGGNMWSSEYRFQRASGSYAPVFDRGYIQRDEAHHTDYRVL